MTMDDIVQGADVLADAASKQQPEVGPIRKVAVIGAGQMGSGIAHVVALGGYDVVLNDLAKERYDAAIQTIDKNLSRQVASGKISEEEGAGPDQLR
jgi:3-hydroxybutyryl-CoA dehydrogenase